ncbi:MAG TPA: hypothetical protein VNH11_12455 [Pirellulales bacterium]|nr:hypothetical protein [Pirellulales bacterium]
MALLAALLHVPVVRSIARRWNRRACEILVDWPPSKPPDAHWDVPLDENACELVRPIKLMINALHVPRGHLSFGVEFESKGPIIPDARRRLTVEVLDATGRVLASDQIDYTDERIQERGIVSLGPVSLPVGPGPNCPMFVLTVAEGHPARVRLTFSDQG